MIPGFITLKLGGKFVILTTNPSASLTMAYNTEACSFMKHVCIWGTLCP